MGAWGYEPMENDEALEWMANRVECKIVEAVEAVVKTFVLRGRPAVDDNEYDGPVEQEVEAALALLIDLTRTPSPLKYSRFDHISAMAQARNLWELGTQAIQKMMADDEWLSGWNSPSTKKNELSDLLAELRQRGMNSGGTSNAS